MDSECIVSVICVSYNHERYIRQAMDSILAQKTSYKYEIIVHDDASTDGTVNIIREYAERFPDIIHPILQEENQYSQHIDFLQEFVYPKARGKYIAFCEGDDFWTDAHKLQKQIDYMEKHPKCNLCGCNSSMFDDIKQNFLEKNVAEDYKNQKVDLVTFLQDILGVKGFNATASKVVRRECLPHTKWLNRFSFGDLFLDLFPLIDGYCYHFNEVMVAYRINSIGSYNDRINKANPSQRVKGWMKYYYEMIEALEYFNVFTEYRYSDAIEIAKNRYRYKYLPEYGMENVFLSNKKKFIKILCRIIFCQWSVRTMLLLLKR